MISTIVKAAISFCEHQLAKTCTQDESECLQPLFIASIDMLDSSGKMQIDIGITQPLLQSINTLFLNEAHSSQEELIAMLLEVTNMIVGSAKVLIQDELNSERFITVPYFKEYGTAIYKVGECATLRVDCGCLMICAKDMHE